MLYGMRLSLKHIQYFMLPKIVCVLLTINLFCLFSCYFIFLLTLSKWNPVFVRVCQFEFNHEQQASTVFQNVPEGQEPELRS